MNFIELAAKFFGSFIKRPAEIDAINALEEKMRALSDGELKREGQRLKEKAQQFGVDETLVEAFALVRETARRTLGQRHFDVQLWGGLAIHRGCIAEMSTGEGKTLAATAPIFANALLGSGVHVVTVNDYLARRDTVWMGQIYHRLGLSVACIIHDAAFMYDPLWKIPKEELEVVDQERDEKGSFLVKMDFLRPISRKDAYAADITYGTSHEFGFDYLRDNLSGNLQSQVQRGHHYAVIDEIDSILIDEARTPLIISVADTASSEYYRIFAQAVSSLQKDVHYVVDEKLRSAEITEEGINRIEKITNINNLYSAENLRLVHYLEASLKAKALYEHDRDYVVKDGEVIIVDQFTGRLMEGRRYSAGLHQAIEAKEGVKVQEESKTYAQISIQNYFRMYKKLSGMTGTAQTSAEEFHKVYGLETVSVPTNKPLARKDMRDLVYKTTEAKYAAIAEHVRECVRRGQPVLIGTVSIEKNDALSKYFKQTGIAHEVLNAKNHEREGGIIAQAGRAGAVTIATNMAGRGVDIKLGGNPCVKAQEEKVLAAGGLHVIGTERHEARRIDNQLRGRAGRQGDAGSSQFYLSLEDDLMRIFGGDKIKNLMNSLNIPDDMPIENGLINRSIAQAQNRVEGFHFDARKHLLEYDDILNKQRLTIYRRRQRILNASPEDVKSIMKDSVIGCCDRIAKLGDLTEEHFRLAQEAKLFAPEEKDSIKTIEDLKERALSRVEGYGALPQIAAQMLSLMDFMWMNHLEDIDSLTESVRIRAYGQRDPLVEYRRDSKVMFEQMLARLDEWVFLNAWKFEEAVIGATVTMSAPKENVAVQKEVNPYANEKVGRNDDCPCGSGKKYKKCHGK